MTTQLLIHPDQQRRAFDDACAWADEIVLCVGWLEGGEDQGPSWDVLEPHLSKVRGAYVGFAFMRTEVSLLRALYERGTLHIVSSTDGGFSPNTYVFTRGAEVRAIKVEGLELVTDRERIRRGAALLVTAFERACSWEGDAYIRSRRARGNVWTHHVEALALWGAFYRVDEILVAAFGSRGPVAALNIAVAADGFDRKATGAFFAANGAPNLYLGVRGVKEGRAVVQPDDLFAHLPAAPCMEQGREGRSLIVGDVTSTSFVSCAAAFVHAWQMRMELL